MLNQSIQKITNTSLDFPIDLQHITPIPSCIYIQSRQWQALLKKPRVAIIGSRKISPYGKEITHRLARELAQAGVVIVSGLAYGVDSVAHRAALEQNGLTIAVLPAGLDTIYPAAHQYLAAQIIKQGGALISEHPEGTRIYKNSFIARNRVVAGLAHILLVTEAVEKSGTFHTVRFALEQGKDVLAVPGNITSPGSVGTNNLIKSGATPVTSSTDVLNLLGIQPANHTQPVSNDPRQQSLLTLLEQGTLSSQQLKQQSQLTTEDFQQALTMLEIEGAIRPLGNAMWSRI